MSGIELVQSYAFRTAKPCRDGGYPTMLYRCASRFNHSCFPNAGGHLPGGEDFERVKDYVAIFSIYALDEVRPGEEVCISYLSTRDQLQPLAHRRQLLQTWNFHCRCPRCLGDRPLDRRLELGDREVIKEAQRAWDELAGEDVVRLGGAVEAALSTVQRG